MNAAIIITVLRIVLIPFIIMALIQNAWHVALVLFAVAAVTDLLDGAIARAFNQQTFLGACLDPIADKVLLLATFTTLAYIENPFFKMPHWFVYVMWLKEILLVGAIGLFFFLNIPVTIAPTKAGKYSTFLQICFLLYFFVIQIYEYCNSFLLNIMLVFLFCLMGVTLVHYAHIGLRRIKYYKRGY